VFNKILATIEREGEKGEEKKSRGREEIIREKKKRNCVEKISREKERKNGVKRKEREREEKEKCKEEMKERNENGLDNIVPSLTLIFLPVKANCHLQRKST
jgi:hypothetical protein